MVCIQVWLVNSKNSWQCPLLVCCILGDWCTVTVQRERVWRDDGQKEALWLAGPDFSQIRPHGQWLLCVRNHHISSDYYSDLLMTLLTFLQFQCRNKLRCVLWLNTATFFLCRIALTKLDILDTLPEIKVGVAYKVDGQPLPSFPGRSFLLGLCLLITDK